jgi:hypothetical protein
MPATRGFFKGMQHAVKCWQWFSNPLQNLITDASSLIK